MKFRAILISAFALALSIGQCFAQATIMPPGETCFSALSPTSGGPNNTGTGFIGLLGSITGGSGYTNGTYGGVTLTGGNGTNATANITVSGGIVTQVAILNPGLSYVIGDILSASAANLGGTGSGFSVPVSSLSINYSLAGGSVGFYIPNMLSFKQTWQDSGQTTLNQNPVPLDANGCAVIYGAGIYRQILKDSLGNTVWDKPTASTSPVGIFWAGLATGTGNAIAITDSAFALQDGATIQFLAKANNTGPTTVSVSGGAAIAIVNDTSTGPAALSGGEIGQGNTPLITYDATNVEFHLVNPAATTSSGGGSTALSAPQGYLNLVGASSGSVIQSGDVIGTGVVYYSPYYGGNTLPIWNGSTFKIVTFSELTATLTAAGSAASAIQDSCVFSNNGVPTLVTGPAWTTATAGAGNRGTGAGTAQITRLQGIWVNANTIVAYNGLSSYSIAANQCTYVGSIAIDATPGQVTATVTYGQSRKWGVWNAYNRAPIQMKAGEATASWAYGTNTIRAANGAATNSITVFQGLPEEGYSFSYTSLNQSTSINSGATYGGQIGIGFNSTTVYSGQSSQSQNFNNLSSSGSMNIYQQLQASFRTTPSLGINVITALESGLGSASNCTFQGTEAHMVLTAAYRG